MATPLGHSLVGYALARAAGVRTPRGYALAIGAASLPDVDFLLGYVANGDPMSLHHEVITHKPVFPLLVGGATGLAVIAGSLLRGRLPKPSAVLKPAALAAALVGSHVVMDPLPLPYDSMPLRNSNLSELVAAQSWNVVIDMAVYGAIAVLAFDRTANGKTAEAS